MIFIAVLLLAIAIGVNAYGTSDPATFGHSEGELDIDFSTFCRSDGTNCPTILNQNLEIRGNLTVTDDTILNRLFQEVECTSSGYAGCESGTSYISGEELSVTECNDECEVRLNNAKEQIGCWLISPYNGLCYCRAGVPTAGSNNRVGGCGPREF